MKSISARRTARVAIPLVGVLVFAALVGILALIFPVHAAAVVAVDDGTGLGTHTLEAPEGSWGSFGSALDTDGRVLVVGAYSTSVDGFPYAGVVHVYRLAEDGWQMEATLSSPFPLPDEAFGISTVLSGDMLFVGTADGRLYVFQRTDSQWQCMDDLSDPQRRLGRMIGGDRDIAVADINDGAAVFVRQGATWVQEATITAPSFWGLTVSDGRIIICADYVIFIYRRTPSGWVMEASIFDIGPSGCRPRSVALFGDTLVTGWSAFGTSVEGAAYVYRRQQGEWVREAALVPPGAAEWRAFGSSVATAGDRVWVAAPRSTAAGRSGAGAVYEYRRTASGWVQYAVHTSPTPLITGFGESVAVGGGMVAVGTLYPTVHTMPVAHETSEDGVYLKERPGVLWNDRPDSGSLSATLVAPPRNGEAVLAEDGSFSYVPHPDFHGRDEFSYRAFDGVTESEPATVVLTITPVNDAPTFVPGPDVTVLEDCQPYSAAWAASLSPGPANESLQRMSFATSSDAPALFALQPAVDASGKLTFTPAPDANGAACVTVTLTDDASQGGPALSAIARFTVRIIAVNDPPLATLDMLEVDEDHMLEIGWQQLLANDSDAEAQLTTSGTLASTPGRGTLSRTETGLRYVPDADVHGYDSFRYTCSDGVLDSAPATVSIHVRPLNDPPVAREDTLSTSFMTTLALSAPGLLANDDDIDGDTLLAASATAPAHGDVTIAPDGSVTYLPDEHFSGRDEFTYRVVDEAGGSAEGTVSVAVAPPPRTCFEEVAGADRFATAVAVSRRSFPSGCTTAVVATGRDWPDALGASALAGAIKGPVLLVDTRAVPPDVLLELKRLGVRDVIIVGGDRAVGQQVEAALALIVAGKVERLGGADRYSTAEAVASRVVSVLGDRYDGGAFVTTGRAFPDAVAASPLAAAGGWPIYLAPPSTDVNRLALVLRERHADRVYILGSPNALPVTLEEAFVEEFGRMAVQRVGGADRYATAAALARLGVERCSLRLDGLALATGQDFPDAATGGAMQGAAGSVLLLTPRDALHPSVAELLSTERDHISRVIHLGSPRAVSVRARSEVARLLH